MLLIRIEGAVINLLWINNLFHLFLVLSFLIGEDCKECQNVPISKCGLLHRMIAWRYEQVWD